MVEFCCICAPLQFTLQTAGASLVGRSVCRFDDVIHRKKLACLQICGFASFSRLSESIPCFHSLVAVGSLITPDNRLIKRRCPGIHWLSVPTYPHVCVQPPLALSEPPLPGLFSRAPLSPHSPPSKKLGILSLTRL